MNEPLKDILTDVAEKRIDADEGMRRVQRLFQAIEDAKRTDIVSHPYPVPYEPPWNPPWVPMWRYTTTGNTGLLGWELTNVMDVACGRTFTFDNVDDMIASLRGD